MPQPLEIPGPLEGRRPAHTRRGRGELPELAPALRRPMRPQTVVEALTDALSDDAIVTGDAGAVTAWAARLRLRRGMQFSFSGTLCSMGAALPPRSGPSSPIRTGR